MLEKHFLKQNSYH